MLKIIIIIVILSVLFAFVALLLRLVWMDMKDRAEDIRRMDKMNRRTKI